MKTAIYCRVSTDEQSTDNQLPELLGEKLPAQVTVDLPEEDALASVIMLFLEDPDARRMASKAISRAVKKLGKNIGL